MATRHASTSRRDNRTTEPSAGTSTGPGNAPPVSVWLTDHLNGCATCQADGTATSVLPAPVGPCAGRFPVGLAIRIVTEFSNPGDVVLTTGAGTSVACAAARAGRRVLALTPDTAAARHVEAELAKRLSVFDLAGIDVRVGTAAELLTPVRNPSPLADLVVLPAPCGPGTGPDERPEGRTGRQNTGRQNTGGQNTGHEEAGQGEEAFAACQRLLRPGGMAVAASREGFPPGRAGHLIARARAAGLIYLQHLVAVHAPVADGRLQPDPSGAERALVRWVGDPRVHLPVHSDLIVLLKPAAGGAHG